MLAREVTLLLGEDHPRLGEVEVRVQAERRTTSALSAGASLLPGKNPSSVVNEDALLAVDEGPRTLLAVADAHYGHEASHELLRRLVEVAHPLPTNPLELLELLLAIPDDAESARHASETTLLIALRDRAMGAGFGLSYGDSSLVVLGPGRRALRANRKDNIYVSPCRPTSLDPRRATEFSFTAGPDDVVLAFTDGVDECHYRSPETSIQGHHIEEQWAESGGGAEALARRLAGLALEGVGGCPGGEDNLALVVLAG